MASFKPSCLITERVAGLCDGCGNQVGYTDGVVHLLEELGRMAIYCAACCPACATMALKCPTPSL